MKEIDKVLPICRAKILQEQLIRKSQSNKNKNVLQLIQQCQFSQQTPQLPLIAENNHNNDQIKIIQQCNTFDSSHVFEEDYEHEFYITGFGEQAEILPLLSKNKTSLGKLKQLLPRSSPIYELKQQFDKQIQVTQIVGPQTAQQLSNNSFTYKQKTVISKNSTYKQIYEMQNKKVKSKQSFTQDVKMIKAQFQQEKQSNKTFFQWQLLNGKSIFK
ncbi:Hypothetical_protein [Hexamita inflata]|uniref:Hypothetical_protein n=1 Tax=Hexamita inflata TaxID=28002 RepID=A0AA86RK49_9EUKA|nr:Hypothetical protein HINF_LOCUS55690 [Hexamita inflata]